MDKKETLRPSPIGLIYAAVGITLFVIGGLSLEESMQGDGMSFTGWLCLSSGLVGIVAGGVALGNGR